MATLNDLVGQIENDALRERIEEELRRVAKQKKFGLVFEEHLPECTPLWEIPVKRGSLVAKKDGKMSDVWRVLEVADGKAVCVKDGGLGDGIKNAETQRREETNAVGKEFDLSELVVVAKFGEPIYPYLKPLDTVANAPESDLWHTLIEADNYHALQFLEYVYAGKVDCIYIDPPYNTGAKDWKYNNDFVDDNDSYRHSKWLSMMQKRLALAKKLLNPRDSVLIVTIDEKEYLHLGCLLEEMFPEARIQMVSSVINPSGVAKNQEFSRSDEYLFFVKFGTAGPQTIPLSSDWSLGKKNDNGISDPYWRTLRRRGSNDLRKDRPNLFYPIFVETETGKILRCGEALPLGQERESLIAEEGESIVWPIKSDGSEGRWQISRSEVIDKLSKGYVKVNTKNEFGWVPLYLAKGEIDKINSGTYLVKGRGGANKEIQLEALADEKVYVPSSQWRIPSHNAREYGSVLLNGIIGSNRFSFPKSLYAVHDALRFFVANKPDAIIVDFFAGSGTTLHAVNLLNAEDGGRRQCVMVTNNEVSEAEAKALRAKGCKPGDEEWERLGIARHVTWPRTVCSIEGHDVNGQPLKGNYGVEVDDYALAVAEEGDSPGGRGAAALPRGRKLYRKTKRQMYPKLAGKAMADGFKANVAFFKLGFLDKTSVSLGRQFREMLPTLWMKAGAHGPCPTGEILDAKGFLILPANRFAVLLEESAFRDFLPELERAGGIETVYLVTDYAQSYKSMANALKGRTTYQLYRDYLDNFRINKGRN